MTTQFTAIYEGGLLRPTVPLVLPEGTQVEVIVVTPPTAGMVSAAEILAQIAAMPLEEGPDFAGRNHDKILYGDRGSP
jgi:predicted DNA-binding antitoxin AbrB/MazE fold protein